MLSLEKVWWATNISFSVCTGLLSGTKSKCLYQHDVGLEDIRKYLLIGKGEILT